MQKLFLLFTTIIISLNSAFAQLEVVDTIFAIKNDSLLNEYFINNSFVQKNNLKVDFKKQYLSYKTTSCDIFGDSIQEVVFILNDNHNLAVNFFYFDNGELLKTEENITISYSEAFFDVEFEYFLQDICPNQKTFLTKETYSYNCFDGTYIKIWNVNKDTVFSIYSFPVTESDYSGFLTSDYSLETNYFFELNQTRGVYDLNISSVTTLGVYEVGNLGDILSEKITTSINKSIIKFSCYVDNIDVVK
ncbi:MAG: hypothetical protein JXR68_05425 [Bacteroidales bacterium]|nr:hypothetical protein [Bacteroidales bacterium]